MKKIILILVLTFFFTFQTASAQFSFSIGPKAGLSVADFDVDEDNNSVSAHVAFAGGAFLGFNFGRVFTIQPELLIRQRGAKVDDNTLKLNYFEVPILAKLHLPLGDKVLPNIFAGPSFAFRYGSSLSIKDNSSGGLITWKDGDFEKTDVLGVFGAGIDFLGENSIVTLDARRDIGFSNVNKNDAIQVNYKNRDWTFMLGIGFRIGD